MHSQVTRVQSCNTGASYKYKCMLSKFRLSWLSTMFFSCTLLTCNNMISPVIWCNVNIGKFSKTTNCTCPTDSCNFVVFEKFTRGHLHQIAFEIMLLAILIIMLIITTINQCTYHISIYDCEREKILRWWVRHIRISCCHSKNCAAWTDVLQLKESFLENVKMNSNVPYN